MKAYRLSIRLKLALIVFAGLIALASLAYTHRLVDRLRDREQAVIELWAGAQAQVAQSQARSINPYQAELQALEQLLEEAARTAEGAAVLTAEGDPLRRLTPDEARAYRRAVGWAQGMPSTGELNFILSEILEPNPFSIPAIITDSTSTKPLFWRNVDAPESLAGLSPSDSVETVEKLRRMRIEMDQTYAPIPIEIDYSGLPGTPDRLTQYVHYDESSLVKELRIFPYVQLLFVGLFILVGYLGFSYVRRSEQSSLWVGMAREAAHQLGTPISSLMGWTELLRLNSLSPAQYDDALDEIENDIHRLRRVASRFSDIGSLPKLSPQPIVPIIEGTADYIRRRIPQQSQRVTLNVHATADPVAPVNEELFGWVIENLLKNALDAMDGPHGRIDVYIGQREETVSVDVRDTGSGIERHQWKNVFRPGYSTKKRGWGLGLSLARRVVEDYHGGTLRLTDSKIGEGTTFRIEIPASSVHSESYSLSRAGDRT